jgi:hypothetical protein
VGFFQKLELNAIRYKFCYFSGIHAVYAYFGYIGDVTSIMEQNSDILKLKTNTSGIPLESLNVILVIFERFSLSEISRLKMFVFKSQKRRKRSENEGDNNMENMLFLNNSVV